MQLRIRNLSMDCSHISKKIRKNDDECCQDESVMPCSPERSSPVVVFAHGAGAPSSSEWMIRWKDMINKALQAVEVITFDYPYLAGGKRKVPPKAEKLVDFHMNIVKETAAKFSGHPLILAGKSMGSRVSCMVALNEDIPVSAVICLGYPLKGIKGAIRDQILLELKVPVMFVQIDYLMNSGFECGFGSSMWFESKGSKDSMCPLDKFEAVRNKMKPKTELHVIDGGDHSFKIGKKHLETKDLTQDSVEDLALQAVSDFVSKALSNA